MLKFNRLTFRTAYYAFELAKVIQLNHSGLITGSETLCITLAALCHDLGHGPYSHLFEDVLPLQDGNKKFKVNFPILFFL